MASKIATMKQGGDRRSENFKRPIGPLVSQEKAAKMMNVSPRSVQRATAIQSCRKSAGARGAMVYTKYISLAASVQHIFGQN